MAKSRMNPSMMPVVMRKQCNASRSKTAALIGGTWLASLSVATQTVAWQVAYNPVLGPHWNHIYYPWKIIQWGTSWYSQNPNMFHIAAGGGMTLCAALHILLLVRKSVLSNTANPNGYLHGSARWADMEDLKKADLLGDGVYIGGYEDKNGNSLYLRHSGSEHLLIIAPTRSGKGICLVVPTLLSWPASCVITDLKGELWALTSGWRQKYAQNKVLRFEPASTGSIGWNPMDEIRLGEDYETGDVQNLATLIVDPDGKGLKDHWQKTAQALLVGCILHLLYKRKADPKVEASLRAVDRMLADPDKPLADLWQEMVTFSHKDGKPLDTVVRSAQDMIERPDDEAGSVISTTKSYLSLFRDNTVAENVSESGFRVRDLMNYDNPISLYIVTQPEDKERLRPLVRILINMICRLLAGKMDFVDTPMKEYSAGQKIWRIVRGKSIGAVGGGRRGKGKYKHKLLMMMDEFPSLGKLGIVQESLAFLAGYGIRFYIITQDITQLRNEEIGYGRNEAISSNCHIQIAFQPNNLDTAVHFSKLTGQTTIVKEQVTVSGKRLGGILGNVSRTMQETSRPLMTEDECMRMPPPEKDGDTLVKGGDMLIYMAGFPAIYGKQKPYFLDPVFQARSSVNPPDETDYIYKTGQKTITLESLHHEQQTEKSTEKNEDAEATATEDPSTPSA
ncbi:MAG: type IV secretory system conjugative DNA transfer family protein [Pseudomonadota bacterium]